jgi:acetylserotonin N-methyltransferase
LWKETPARFGTAAGGFNQKDSIISMKVHGDPAGILDLIQAFRRSKTMFTAVRLGVFDKLEDNPGTAAGLARDLNVNPGALQRLLNGCVSLNLLRRDGDDYHNTPAASRYLATHSPDTLSGYIRYSDESLWQLWSHLDDAVREGTNRWTQAFGSRSALFDHYFRDEAAARSFLGGMHGFGQLGSRVIVRAFDLSRFHHLVDLGGATGHLAIAACEAYAKLRATVLDLPKVERFAQSYIEASSVADRVEFLAGDFFQQPLPHGDLYALGRILHDWDEPKITSLLAKISLALQGGGALLIVETLMNDDQSGPVHTLMQDLNMLVATEGRERTTTEYGALLKAAGFRDVQFHRTGLPVDAILAIK